MPKNKILCYMLIIMIAFTTVFSFSQSKAAISEQERKKIRDLAVKYDPIELTFSEFALGIGDYFMEYLTFLVKEEVTIEKIIFNDVDVVNANFFSKTPNTSSAPATKILRDVINTWYEFLGKITIVIYLISLVTVGIMIMLGGAQRKADAKELLKKWTIGVAIFYMFPYVMRYAFDLNQSIINSISNQYRGETDTRVKSYIGSISDLRKGIAEKRDPTYITSESFELKLGSDEATAAYINRLEDYKAKGDAMRIIRSLAGITGRIIYVIIWFIMLWQLCIFLYIYYKRYLMIAFLIAIFPITLVQYIIGTLSTGKQTGITSWCKEFFTNLFIQTIHAIIYGIISGVILNQVMAAVKEGNPYELNWFLMICAINFVFSGEKIVREIMNAGMTESTKTAEDLSKSARGGIKGMRGRIVGARGKVQGWISKIGK